jgi:hypothetical protein
LLQAADAPLLKLLKALKMSSVSIVEDKYQKGVYYVDGQTWSVSITQNHAGSHVVQGYISLVMSVGWHPIQSCEGPGQWKLLQCGISSGQRDRGAGRLGQL